MSKGSIGPGDSEVWNDPFFLPPMPPSEMRGCSYIDIRYSLKVTLKVKFYLLNGTGYTRRGPYVAWHVVSLSEQFSNPNTY